MARIVYISKYPPLEGGIAAKTYWLTKALAKEGHSVHVVTDRNDVAPTYAIGNASPIQIHPSISIHRPQGEVPWHIPQDNHRAIELLDQVLQVVEKEKPEIISASYLVPYGLVAYLAKKITGLPYVLSHGGSDLKKFVETGLWSNIWKQVLSEAEWVITDAVHKQEIERWNVHTSNSCPYVPDPSIFTPELREKREKPVLALIGKANFYWQHKGWHRVIDIWSKMGEDFNFLIVSQGNGLEKFQSYVRQSLGNKIIWRSFVPPWEMPELLRSVDALFNFEADLPFDMYSNLAPEALLCGTALIVDRADLVEKYKTYGLDLTPSKGLIVEVPPHKPLEAAEKIRNFLAQPNYENLPRGFCGYEEYIAANLKVFTPT